MHLGIFGLFLIFSCQKKEPKIVVGDFKIEKNLTFESRSEATQFLYDAILMGFIEDNASKNFIKGPVFIIKCRICGAVQRAFRNYPGPRRHVKATLDPSAEESSKA